MGNFEDTKRLKKCIIIICVIVIIIAIIVYAVNKGENSNNIKEDNAQEEITEKLEYDAEGTIKEWTNALSSKEDMENFIKKNLNYSAWYIWTSMEEGQKEENFEAIYDTLKKDDSDEDIITNVSEKMLSEFWNEEYSEYNSPELKKIEKVGKYESFKVFDKIDFTISYLAGHGVRNEKSLAAIFYRGKIIKVISNENN